MYLKNKIKRLSLLLSLMANLALIFILSVLWTTMPSIAWVSIGLEKISPISLELINRMNGEIVTSGGVHAMAIPTDTGIRILVVYPSHKTSAPDIVRRQVEDSLSHATGDAAVK